jgi:TRAP-type mannitol/chloroaromatic compound transport system permease small subunit
MPARLLSMLDNITDWLGRLTAWFAVLMVLVTCYVVLMRYMFDSGSIAVQEVIMYLNTLIFTIGAAYTLRHDGHVRVDIFYSKAARKSQTLINLAGTFLLLFPVVIFILVYCWNYVAAAWAIHEQSGDPGGLPWVYLLKTLIIVMGMLLLVQGATEVLRQILVLRHSPGVSAEAGEDDGMQL